MLHQVYMNIPLNYLSQIPDRRRWLLGRDGRLYAKQDISQHRLLRDDDPDMADTIAQQASGISFLKRAPISGSYRSRKLWGSNI